MSNEDQVFTATLAANETFLIPMGGKQNYNVRIDWDVTQPALKAFVADTPAVAATLVNQGVTYTAAAAGTDGNRIRVQLIDPNEEDATLSVKVVGRNLTRPEAQIEVKLATDSGGDITTTATQLVAAINGNADAAALVTASGSGATALTATAKLALTGGANLVPGDVDVAKNEIELGTHGYKTGLQVALTGASLPGGLSATNYWIIEVSGKPGEASTKVKLATSKSNALAGTAVNITSSGAGTLTPAALSGASGQLKSSENGISFSNVGSADTMNTTGGASKDSAAQPFKKPLLRYDFAVTTGQVALRIVATKKP